MKGSVRDVSAKIFVITLNQRLAKRMGPTLAIKIAIIKLYIAKYIIAIKKRNSSLPKILKTYPHAANS